MATEKSGDPGRETEKPYDINARRIGCGLNGEPDDGTEDERCAIKRTPPKRGRKAGAAPRTEAEVVGKAIPAKTSLAIVS